MCPRFHFAAAIRTGSSAASAASTPRSVTSSDRSVPDALRKGPQRERQVSADPLNFAPFIERPVRQPALRVDDQVRQRVRHFAVATQQAMPDRPRPIDPSPQANQGR
jgi:hypothetical protein